MSVILQLKNKSKQTSEVGLSTLTSVFAAFREENALETRSQRKVPLGVQSSEVCCGSAEGARPNCIDNTIP